MNRAGERLRCLLGWFAYHVLPASHQSNGLRLVVWDGRASDVHTAENIFMVEQLRYNTHLCQPVCMLVSASFVPDACGRTAVGHRSASLRRPRSARERRGGQSGSSVQGAGDVLASTEVVSGVPMVTGVTPGGGTVRCDEPRMAV